MPGDRKSKPVDEWRGLTPRERRLFATWEAFAAACETVVERLEQALSRECDLPLAWYDVLFQLNRAPRQRLFMHQLAAAVLVSKSGLTRRIDQMESAGLVRREAVDRRSTHIVLTEAGKATLKRAVPVAQRAIRRHFADCVTDEEIEPLDAVVRRIAECG